MPNLAAFEERISTGVHSALSAKEMAEQIVIAALEAEYGKTFTLTPGFAKMTNALAEMLVTNPELRRQALHIASV
ncbi:MAG: hypothetical protein PHH14_07280, partial [Candidatus Margulisbacteria bacterium]|nr:hypothetical protein [Candidatus Margulisiibacteriota bacterium]